MQGVAQMPVMKPWPFAGKICKKSRKKWRKKQENSSLRVEARGANL